jgi:hypothetical protein
MDQGEGCQKLDWKSHKSSCQAPGTGAGEATSTRTIDIPESSVLLLSLDDEPSLTHIWSELLSTLRSKAQVMLAKNIRSAIDILSSPSASTNLVAVLVTDASLLGAKNKDVAKKLVEYARSGGTVICGCNFSSFAPPNKFDAFFDKIWGVGWKFGSYHRTTFALNTSVTAAERLRVGSGSLPNSYSMKAVHVKEVSRGESVYLATSDSRINR